MRNNSNNFVYKCERCGNLFADSDLANCSNEENFGKHAYDVRHAKYGQLSLCPECLEALTEFMQHPKKAEKEPDLGDMSTADIQRMAIQMMIDKAWEELKKPGTDAEKV